MKKHIRLKHIITFVYLQKTIENQNQTFKTVTQRKLKQFATQFIR